MVESEDDGSSWSLPQIIIDTPIDDRDPHITQLSDGQLMLSWFSTDHSKQPSVSHSFVATSSDYGRTWSRPLKVSDRPAATSEQVLELPDGRLLLPVYRTSGNEPTASILMSSQDRGQTWQEASIIAEPAADKDFGFNETALVYLGRDHLVAVIRTEDKEGYAYINHSFDLGATWGTPEKLPFKSHAPDMLLLEDGVFLTYGSVAYPGRWVAGVLGNAAGNFTGAVETIIYTGSSVGDMSYPSAVQIDRDTILVVYYDAGAGYIGGRFVAIKDLRS